MTLNFTTDLLPFYASKLAADPNYQSPGNFGLSSSGAGTVGVDHATVGTRGSYTTAPTASDLSGGGATFQVLFRVVTVTSVATAGTIYAPGNILKLTGGSRTTQGALTVATVQLVSATIAAGGTGYGAASTFNVSVAGGTHSVTATVNVTTSAGGVVTTINSVSNAGSYTVLPTLAANAVTGDNGTDHGTGLTLNLVFGVLTTTISTAGVYQTFPANPVATTTTGSGTGATFNLAWAVDSINVLTPGSYQVGTPPTITFSSGAATATAVLASAPATSTDTQKLLVMVDILRSMIAEASNGVDLKDIHEVLRRMMSTMKFGGKTSFTAATFATNAQKAALNYIAKNPTHGGAAI